jgi:hypothetical protein
VPHDDTPNLRPRGVVDRILTIAEKHVDKGKCKRHCRCVTVLRREVAIIMAVFLLFIGALIRREILSYVAPLPDALPPVRSGYVLPGADSQK